MAGSDNSPSAQAPTEAYKDLTHTSPRHGPDAPNNLSDHIVLAGRFKKPLARLPYSDGMYSSEVSHISRVGPASTYIPGVYFSFSVLKSLNTQGAYPVWASPTRREPGKCHLQGTPGWCGHQEATKCHLQGTPGRCGHQEATKCHLQGTPGRCGHQEATKCHVQGTPGRCGHQEATKCHLQGTPGRCGHQEATTCRAPLWTVASHPSGQGPPQGSLRPRAPQMLL